MDRIPSPQDFHTVTDAKARQEPSDPHILQSSEQSIDPNQPLARIIALIKAASPKLPPLDHPESNDTKKLAVGRLEFSESKTSTD